MYYKLSESHSHFKEHSNNNNHNIPLLLFKDYDVNMI